MRYITQSNNSDTLVSIPFLLEKSAVDEAKTDREQSHRKDKINDRS